MPGAETRTSAHLCTMPLSVTVTATKLILSASGLQIRFNGQDIVEAKPVPRNIPNTIPQSQEWYVSLKLTGAAKEVYENGIYELRLLDIDPSSQPTWTNNQAGAEQAAADIAVMIRSASGGGGGEVLIRNAADDETLATVTAPDSYVIPPIRIPYVDAAGALQYFVVYVDSIASGELTVTEPGGGAPPVPRFTVRTTDTATVVGYRDLVSPTMDLPQSKIRYKDEANATQELAASDTEFDGTNLRPATIIGRGTMRNSAGTGFDFVTAADLVANAVPDAPDVTYQRVDSASNPIGSPVDVPAGTAPNITCPDGTVTINNSVPTTLHTVAVKSNGSATQAIADSTITKPDGTTVGLPATVALDVRDYRSGIAYQFGGTHWSGQSTSYRTGDEGDLYGASWFSYAPPVYPTHYARLGANRTTLESNNIHGNTDRFTDRSGGQTYSDDIVQDHLTGIEWYRVLQTAATWNDAIDGAESMSVGGNTDWHLPPSRVLDIIANDASGSTSGSLNFAPFSISNTNYWTGSTFGPTTTSAWRMTAQAFAATAKTNTNPWIACRRFI